MSSPAPVDVGDALDDLINQFSDPMSFFRELIQNALDAGSGEVEIDFEFEASSSDPERGAMIVIVADFGEGMDREIIDNKLTRLFSSAKDGDMTKIGKFGIGFVSVFAIEPDAVCVDTARAGEAWRVLFDRQRNFKRLRLDQALEGTTIRIIKNSTRQDFARFTKRAREVIRYWCGHAHGEVRVAGELISEPFGLEAPIRVTYQDEFSHIHIGHRARGQTLHAFFNGGLTLVQADQNHPTAIPHLVGLSFKVSSRYLEHTLTRDDVIKDSHFAKVAKRLRELSEGALRDRVFEELDVAVRAGVPTQPGPEADRMRLLYEAALWHIEAEGEVGRRHAKLACARAPSGRVWTWTQLQKAVKKGMGGWFASGPSPASAAAEARGLAVVQTFGGVSETSHELLLVSPILAMIRCLQKGVHLDPSEWLCDHWFQPVEPSADERRQWAPLANMTRRLLDDTDHKIADVRFAHFADSGSRMGKRVAISQREFGELTPAEEAGELGRGLFSRRRILVVDADHPTVRTLLGLSLREPELAAYQLVKLFLLIGGSIASEDDSLLAHVAMGYRETRCPRPLS